MYSWGPPQMCEASRTPGDQYTHWEPVRKTGATQSYTKWPFRWPVWWPVVTNGWPFCRVAHCRGQRGSRGYKKGHDLAIRRGIKGHGAHAHHCLVGSWLNSEQLIHEWSLVTGSLCSWGNNTVILLFCFFAKLYSGQETPEMGKEGILASFFFNLIHRNLPI